MAAEVEQVGADTPVAKQLTKGQAQSLTDQIRKGLNTVPALLLKAYEGQAHKALGYETWEAYVTAEFQMSRVSAWRNILQGSAQRELSEVAGQTVEVAQRQILDIGQDKLSAFVEQAKVAVSNVPEAERAQVISDLLATEAGRNARATPPRGEVLQPRLMVPAFLQGLWPDIKRAAALEGVQPAEWCVKALSGVLATIEFPPEPEAEKPRRRGRPRQSAGRTDQEGDRGAVPAEVEGDEAEAAEGAAHNPFG